MYFLVLLLYCKQFYMDTQDESDNFFKSEYKNRIQKRKRNRFLELDK